MELNGIHHITAITGDAPRNVDFYTRVLGLRLVAKSVNQDDAVPTYHLFYADESATPGAELTFFEYPRARRGQPGAGMVHRIAWRVGSADALDFWEERLRADGAEPARADGRLRFADPEGMGLELVAAESEEAPLVAEHPEIPAELALLGFAGVRAYSFDPERSRGFLEGTLGFEPRGDGAFEARGSTRSSTYAYDFSRDRGLPGAGTVHHVAWTSPDEEHEAWRRRVAEAGASPTPVIDRYYFRSVYFREPSGVLFELATPSPGFTRDTPLENLGKEVVLPPWLEPQREQIEAQLTPLPDPRAQWTAR